MWLHIASYMTSAVPFDTVKAMYPLNLVDEVIEKAEPFVSRSSQFGSTTDQYLYPPALVLHNPFGSKLFCNALNFATSL